AAGNLYVGNANDGSILKVTTAGSVSTFVPSGSGIVYPNGLAFDSAGNLFVANGALSKLSKVTPGGVVSNFAAPFVFVSPQYLAFDPAGNLYVSCANTNPAQNLIYKVT